MSSVATRSTTAPRKKTRTKEGSDWVAHVVLGVGGVIMAFPFLWQLVMSLSTNAQIRSVPPTFWPGILQFENYAGVFEVIPFGDQLWVSVVITVLRTVGQLLLCSLAGYAFARMRFRGKGIILGLILAILMVPSQVYLIPQYQIIQDLGWLNTIPGIVAPGIFSAFGTFLMRQFFMGLPVELEESARLDGANPFQVFWKVMLPLAKPALSALTIVTALWSWNDLLWPLVVTTYSKNMPLAVGLATMQGQAATDYAVLMAASVMAMAPILILFLVMQRRVIDGLAHTGLK
jgi:multiple sugar transport system permease protein